MLTLSALTLFSCKPTETNIATYTVLRSDFENILYIDGFVEPVRSANVVCPSSIDGTINFLVEDGTIVDTGEVICVIEAVNIQTAYDQMLVELGNVEAALNKTIADHAMQLALLEAQVKNNQADTEIAQLDSLQLIYATPTQKRIKELDLERVAIDKAKFVKKLHSLQIIQKAEIRQREMQIQRTSNRIKSIEQDIESLTIKSPGKGVIMRAEHVITMMKIKVGDPIWDNMPIVKIPEMTEMKVKIMAPERDYKLINVNDSVKYTFDAMPGNTAKGIIKSKSPVGIPIKENSKVKFFEIEASITSYDALPDPGFTANCFVILSQLKDTIIIPQISIFDVDSTKVVYIKSHKGFEQRQIATGLYSSKDAVITAGLKAYEVISLSKPPTDAIHLKTLLPDTTVRTPKKFPLMDSIFNNILIRNNEKKQE